MRRSLIALSLLYPLGLVACDEGPTQVYQPSPPGAADNWNDGKTPASSDATKAPSGFVYPSTGGNINDPCPGEQKAKRWAVMVKEPISPPSKGGGLDISGGDSWAGLTIAEAEKINCQSTNIGDQFGNGTLVNGWGDNYELWMDYRVSTRKALWLNFWPGYLGTLEFKSLDGKDSYTIAVQSQIRKNGQPFILDWVGSGGKNFTAQADELYRALMASYAPGLPVSPAGETCTVTGRCIKGSFGDVAYFYIPPLGWAFWVDNQNAAQPTPSIPTRLDQDLAKVLPFAYAKPVLKLDAEGPTANAGTLNPKSGTACILKMGMTYQELLTNCVQVTGDAKADQTETNKLLGGLSHSSERFGFDVQGVDVNFSDNALGPMDVVRDKDLPHATDTATSFRVDQSTLGPIQNDRDANGNRDLHGTGALYKEYSRIVRSELLRLSGIPDGDTSKCVFPDNYGSDPNFDPAAFIAALPPYCTGFEGFITPAPPPANNKVAKNRTDVGYATGRKIISGISIGLKPGHQKVTFCMDPILDNNGVPDLGNGYQACGAPYGASGDTFSTSFAQALKIFGHGKLSRLPTEAQDVRFFFQQWVKAFAKYMTVGAMNPVPSLAAINIDPNNLFFDSIGAGQFEIGEYVDRRFATTTVNPTDFVITADVKNGIFAGYGFSRDLFRGEEAIYAGVLEDQKDGLGQEDTALLTNIFGSPVLASGWTASSKGQSAYYCATNLDPANCDGQTPPLDAQGNVVTDELGRPLLAPYHGAFGGKTTFTLGDSKIKVMQTFPDIQQALVKIPLYTNPYDPTTAPLPARTTLIPWLSKQPGVGFPVALSGTLDKYIETAQLDFSGTTISANVDYDQTVDPTTHMPDPNKITLLAVETTDFLGEVFLCQDPLSGDLLHARMYTPVANILQWLQDHPGSYASCQMIIRYSPFGNFADYITSLQAGVRLGITQGGGFGRVVDVTLFTPGQ